MRRRPIIIGAVAAVVVVVVWLVALWGPQGSAITRARNKAKAAEEERDAAADRLHRLQATQQDDRLARGQLERLRAAIPDDPGLAGFFLDATDAASRAGVQLVSIAPTPPSAPTATGATGAAGASSGAGTAAGPVPILVTMTLSGGYFQVLDFVNRINGLPRIVVVDGLTITGGGSGATLQVQMTARMFVSSLSPSTAAAGGAVGSATTTTAPSSTTVAPTTSRP